ncbi:tyrosine-protein phosphatase non-receptor type 14 [Condylostylus longicornis]|uniref:tyrosine-protein phosphatase non-receptor type 14 n=1 Tax=Condylostylus longicornis TaxID=2530218 RepID=UPI00244DB82F|nr:tyrosine-protein phosphatase non-receptor type 14 [Condylostylus longicornis]
MPFNFLKKSRHYNVTSKSLFVISVHHLLDTSTTVDCTLSSESTGQECLDNVCQRLSINQPEFFGLRYLVKGTREDLRWVDLERPLSRQLEKYASGSKLYLRVQFYIISGISLLEDEQSRYYYFLQLKSDVVEGRLSCDVKQAVLLALYCRQAEYDSYQKDKNTLEYLKTLLPFPERVIDEGLQENLIEEILQHHPGLQNLTQSAAEECFITVCQQVDGYGQEKFWVKDNHGNEVQLGLSINGIAVINQNNLKFYPWHEVKNVINLKRTFNIEQEGKTVVSFTFPEGETGRYFWRLCVLQHLFYSKYEVNRTSSPSIQQPQQHLTPHSGIIGANGNFAQHQQFIATHSANNLFHNYSEECNDSQEDLLNERLYYTGNVGESHQIVEKKNSLISSNLSLSNSQYLQQQQSQHQVVQHTPPSVIHSHANISAEYQAQPQMHHFTNHVNVNGPATTLSTSQILDQMESRVQSTSCLDLSNNNFNTNQDKERLKALLPTYRAAPDYETAVQQKYHTNSSDVQMIRIPSTAGLYTSSGSQPDIHNLPTVQQRFPDIVSQNSCSIPQNHSINTNLYTNIDLLQRMQMMRLKPPPPYAANRLSSTSTPDLAVAASLRTTPLGYRGNAYVSGSSPDLVSTRTFLNTQYPTSIQYSYLNSMGHSQPYLPGAYDNLNMIEEQPQAIFFQMKKTATAISSYDQHSAGVPQPIYRHSKNNLQQHQNETAPNNLLHKSNTTGSIEPIYENVPFPYNSNSSVSNSTQQSKFNNNSANISSEMRHRTSSIQSAPGGTSGIIEATNPNVLGNNNRIQSNEMIRQQHSHQLPQKYLSNEDKANLSPSYSLQKTQDPQHQSDHLVQQTHHQHQAHQQTQPQFSNLHIPGVTSSTDYLNLQLSSVKYSKEHYNNNATGVEICHSKHQSPSSTFLNSSGVSLSVTNNNFESPSSANVTTNIKEKRRKRWGILVGRSNKQANSSSITEKKSATLGREKTKHKHKEELDQEESNLRHRWSTGLPKLQPLSASFSKDKLCQILDAKLNDPQLFIEFEGILKRRENARYECALLEENKTKNADPMFLPYDDNRVRITPTMENRHGYVNASYISATVGVNQRFYILGQSPHNNQTTQIFWQCVWEADIYFIVQLSDELNYIPPDTKKSVDCGQFQIYQEFSQRTDRCTTSKLRIYHQQTKRQRSVWHLNFADWAEQSCPREVNNFLNFLEELSSVRSASINEVPPGHNSNPPVFINCRDGAGRSGVTLVADLLLYTLDHNQDLDIPRVIAQLRQQRDNLIPSLAQYKFIYALLINYLKRTRLI